MEGLSWEGRGWFIHSVLTENLLMTFIHHRCPEGGQPGGISATLTPDPTLSTKGGPPSSIDQAAKVRSQGATDLRTATQQVPDLEPSCAVSWGESFLPTTLGFDWKQQAFQG